MRGTFLIPRGEGSLGEIGEFCCIVMLTHGTPKYIFFFVERRIRKRDATSGFYYRSFLNLFGLVGYSRKKGEEGGCASRPRYLYYPSI